ncbi:LysR family transcriptional regulator [Legionella sainthelensi]|nr:LysR family transcriptional regulator [Legionella sainthelensi]
MKFYNSLAVFIWVYRLNSFSRAAQKLNISQASVSIHLKNIEHYFGKVLFIREGHKISPTEEAVYLSSILADSVDNLEYIVENFSKYTDCIEGRISVGCIVGIPRFWIIPRISSCPEKGIRILNQIYITEQEIIRDVLDGKIDFGIVSSQNNHKNITCIKFFEDKLALMGATRWAGYIDKTDINTAYKSLKSLTWLSYNKELLFTKEYIKSVFQGKSDFIDPYFVLSDLRGLSFAAIAGYGVCVLPKKLFSYSIHKKLLHIIYSSDIEPPFNTYLIYKTTKLNKRMKFFKDAILTDINFFETPYWVNLYGAFPNDWHES